MKNKKMAIAALLGSSVLLSNNKDKNRNSKKKTQGEYAEQLPELKYIKEGNFKGLTYEDKINPIIIESFTNEGKMVEKKKIGNKEKRIFYFETEKSKYKITGGPEVRHYVTSIRGEEEKKTENKSNFSVKTDKLVDIIPVDRIIDIFEKSTKSKINKEDIELVYYKPENLDKLIPMYQIGKPKSGPVKKKFINIENNKKRKEIDNNLLGTYYPGSLDYVTFSTSLREINIKKKISDGKKINNKKESNDEGSEKKSNFEEYEYEISFKNKDNLDIKNLNLLGNIQVSESKKENDLYTFKCKGNLELGNNIIVNYISKYDLSYNFVINYTVRKPLLGSSKINVIKPVVKPGLKIRGDNNDWGIEWGEDLIGGSCYSNYVNYMNDKTSGLNKYQWIKPNAWKNDFWDQDKSNGLDNFYADDVDTSVVIAHGNGHGFELEGSGPNNGDLTYWNAREGKTWGNKDLEFHAWLSCQVLEEEWTFTDDNDIEQRRKWYERWGPTFNGLHLICGFQTNAYVGTHKHLKYFAKNMYKDEGKTVRRSWFDAADADQPDDVEAVVMGPLISNNIDNTGDFKSINATISGMKRAYWNDKIWGKGGAGKDVTKSSSGKSSQVIGWWRVVHTV